MSSAPLGKPFTPPAGHGPHRYLITVQALNVEDIGIPSDNTPASLGFTETSHILARATVGPSGPDAFPTEDAALECPYVVTRSLDPTGVGRTRWAMRWKPALSAFAITFAERFPAAETH